MTVGLPPILARYQDSEAKAPSVRVIVDREGMAAPFLRDLKSLGHTVVTVLRDSQYDGLESFTEVGMFVPLERERQGQLVTRPSLRPVSLSHCLTRKTSSFLYAWPSFVICAVTFLVVCERREETDADVRKPAWWQAEWKAEPTPAAPTTAKLIPIVTTADTIDAGELAQTYIRRWPGPRKYHSRLSFAAWPGYEPWLWQDAHCELRSR